MVEMNSNTDDTGKIKKKKERKLKMKRKRKLKRRKKTHLEEELRAFEQEWRKEIADQAEIDKIVEENQTEIN